MLYIRLTGEALEKARKSSRLVPKIVMANGPHGPYRTTVWVLPEEASKETPSVAQFDLFAEQDTPRTVPVVPVKAEAKPDAKGKQKQIGGTTVIEPGKRVPNEDGKVSIYQAVSAVTTVGQDGKLKLIDGINWGSAGFNSNPEKAEETKRHYQWLVDRYNAGERWKNPHEETPKDYKPAQDEKRTDPFNGLKVFSLDDKPTMKEWPVSLDEWEDGLKTGDNLEVGGKKYGLYVGDNREKYYQEIVVSPHRKIRTPSSVLKGKINKLMESVSSANRHELSEERRATIDEAFSNPDAIEGLLTLEGQGWNKDKTDRFWDKARESVHPFFGFIGRDFYHVDYLARTLAGIGSSPWRNTHYKTAEKTIGYLEALKKSARDRFGKSDAGFVTMQYLDGFDKHVDKVISEVKEAANKNSFSRGLDNNHDPNPSLNAEKVKLFEAFSGKPAQAETSPSPESLQKEVYELAVQKVKLQKELKAVDDSWYTREEIDRGGRFIRQNVKKVVTKEERDAERSRLNGEIEKLDNQGREKTRALQEAEKKAENKPNESPYKVETVDSYDDKEKGVKTELFKYVDGKNAGKFGLRVVDTDAGEVVPSIKQFTDENQARAAFAEAANLRVGSTKTENGVTYQLNANHRWERVDEEADGKKKLEKLIEDAGGRDKLREMLMQARKHENKGEGAKIDLTTGAAINRTTDKVIDGLANASGLSRAEVLAAIGIKEGQKKPVVPRAKGKKKESGDDLDPNSENYRFKDTGYIAGSRKEMAAERIKDFAEKGQLVRKSDVDWTDLESNPRRAQSVIIKSNLFGKVPWDQLKENGMDAGAGFLIDRVYASVAAEPENDPAKRQDYVYGLESLRDRLEACKTPDEVIGVIKQIGEEIQGEMLNASESEEYQKAYAEYRAKTEALVAVKKEYETLLNEARFVEGEARDLSYEIDKRKRRGWKVDPDLEKRYKEAQAKAEGPRQKAIAFQESHADYLKSSKRDLGNGYTGYDSDKEFEIRKLRDSMSLIKQIAAARNLESNPVTRAWLSLGPKFKAVINYRSYKGSDAFGNHVATVRAGKVKDWSWAEKERVSVKKPTKESVRFQLKVAENFERVGGRKVDVSSTTDLKKMFNLRDVQSGNWVLQDVNSAKFHTEQTAMAFADMADLLGIPDGQVSLNGRLAMAFGARGSGSAGWKKGAAKAHYEPVERVINITKMGGGGSLGHEWFHAFDNMLSEAMGMKASEKGFMLTERIGEITDPELRSAFSNLNKAMMEGTIVPKKTIKYTETDVRTARVFDRSNFGLYGEIKSAGSLQKAVDAIAAKYSRYDEADGDKRTKKALRQRDDWIRAAAAWYDKNPSGGSVAIEVGKPHSAFKEGARDLDQGGSTEYWATSREMGARAFQAYCEDKLAEKGQRNDYLSVYADNKYHVDPLFGVEWKPYPEGEERKRINSAFDKLFEVVRSKNLIQKAIDAENERMTKAIRVWSFLKRR